MHPVRDIPVDTAPSGKEMVPEQQTASSSQPCIGLIGGLAVGASCEYYKRLAEAAEREPIQLRLVLVHAELEAVLSRMRSRDAEGLARYFGGLTHQLAGASATCAAITSVASHMGYQTTCAHAALPLVSILDAVRDEVESRRLGKVALFGSRFAMETQMYGALAGAADVVGLPAQEFAEVDELYMVIARQGFAAPEQEERFAGLARTVMQREKPDAIVLAGTDLAVLYDGRRRPDFPFVDAAAAHVGAIMRFLREQETARLFRAHERSPDRGLG